MKDKYIVSLILLSFVVALAISAFAPVIPTIKPTPEPEYKNVSFTVINKTEKRLIVYMEGVDRGFGPRLLVNPGTKLTPNVQTWKIPNDFYSVETWYGTAGDNIPVGRCFSKVDASYMPGDQITRYYNITKPARMVVSGCYEVSPEVENIYEMNIAEGIANRLNIWFNWAFKFVY